MTAFSLSLPRAIASIRRVARLFSLLLLLGLADLALAAETNDSLEAAIMRGIQSGEDVGALTSEWKRRHAGASKSAAGETTNAHKLLAALRHLEGLLEAARNRDAGEELSRGYELLLAADLLFQEDARDAGRRLAEAGLPAEVSGRLANAERTVRQGLDALYALLDRLVAGQRPSYAEGEPPVGAERSRAIDEALTIIRSRLVVPRAPPLLRGALAPVRPRNLAARPPVVTPVIVPSYSSQADADALPADTEAGPEAPLDQEILEQAQALGYDYVRIFEFVRNEIRSEWYAGSVKGALGALRARAGNDVDQASLLVALMRASGAPARYVRGVVELPVESVANQMGVADASMVTDALARAGVAFNPVVRGGRVAAVQLERTWVTVRIPYTNYRGVMLDTSGKTWLPVDPFTKGMYLQQPAGALKHMGLGTHDLIAEYLTRPQSEDLLSVLRGRVASALPGQDYASLLGSSSIVPQSLGLLPGTLPYAAIAVTGESPALAAGQIVRARLRLYSASDGSGSAGLDITLPLHELSNNRVTLSYTPATVDDHRTTLLWGGLDLVPAYLVKLRPQVRIGGLYRAAGTESLTPGAQARLVIDLIGPFGSESIEQILTIGAYQAIAFGAPEVTRPKQAVAGDSEHDAARLLDGIAQSYLAAWTAGENELAALLAMPLIRPLPSVVTVGNYLRTDVVAGVELAAAWRGVFMDAALRVSEPIGTQSERRDWFTLAALHGSSLEHTIFERQFQVDAISADKGLALAQVVGMPLVRIDSQNMASQLPALAQPQQVKDDIAARVRLGQAVTVAAAALTVDAWTGAVWKAEHPLTGASGYFISGQLAGGASVQYPWTLQFLADALAAPNSEGPNDDPLSAASVTRLSVADGQIGTAGEVLPGRLGVIVRDREGRPVRGAQVTFTVTRGDGKLDGETNRVVTTSATGLAEVSLELGQKTDANPIYARRKAGDKYPYQVGLNVVDVQVASATGVLRTDKPFQAYGFPGEVAELERSDIHKDTSGGAGLWLTTAHFIVRDQYKNPVANVPVSFAAQAPLNACNPGPSRPPNPALLSTEDCPGVPIYGQCGSPAASDESDALGSVALYVFVDSVASTIFPVAVQAGGRSQTIEFFSWERCTTEPLVYVSTYYVSDEAGRNINATKAGTRFAEPVLIRLLHSVPTVYSTKPCRYLPDRNLYPVENATLTLTVSGGGSAPPPSALGNGFWQAYITTGHSAAENTPTLTYVATLPDPCDGEDATFSGTHQLSSVWGLQATIDEVTSLGAPEGADPARIHLSQGRSTYPASIAYTIAPSEYHASLTDVEVTEGGDTYAWLTARHVRAAARSAWNGAARSISTSNTTPRCSSTTVGPTIAPKSSPSLSNCP